MSRNVVIDLTGDEESEETQQSEAVSNERVTSPSKDIKSYFPITKANSPSDTPSAKKRLGLDEEGNDPKKVNIIAVRRKPGTNLQESPQAKSTNSCESAAIEKNVTPTIGAAPKAAANIDIRNRIQETLSRIKKVLGTELGEEEPSKNESNLSNKNNNSSDSNEEKWEKGFNSSMDLIDQYFPSSGDLKAARAMLGITDEDEASIQMIERESIELCKNLIVPSLPLTEEAGKLDLDIEHRLRSIAKVVDSSKALRALGIDEDVEQTNNCEGADRVDIDDDDEEEGPVHENDDECYACGEGGLLYLCDRCPKSFHADCMDDEPPSKEDGDDAESEEFICPVCLGEDFIDDDSDEEINVRKATELCLPFRQAREARVNELKAEEQQKNSAANTEEEDTSVKDRHTQALRSLAWNMDEDFETITREIERAGKFAEGHQLKGREATFIASMVKKQRKLEEARRLELSLRRKSSPKPSKDDDDEATKTKKKQKKTQQQRDSFLSPSSSSDVSDDDNEYQLHFDPGDDVVSE